MCDKNFHIFSDILLLYLPEELHIYAVPWQLCHKHLLVPVWRVITRISFNKSFLFRNLFADMYGGVYKRGSEDDPRYNCTSGRIAILVNPTIFIQPFLDEIFHVVLQNQTNIFRFLYLMLSIFWHIIDNSKSRNLIQRNILFSIAMCTIAKKSCFAIVHIESSSKIENHHALVLTRNSKLIWLFN